MIVFMLILLLLFLLYVIYIYIYMVGVVHDSIPAAVESLYKYSIIYPADSRD